MERDIAYAGIMWLMFFYSLTVGIWNMPTTGEYVAITSASLSLIFAVTMKMAYDFDIEGSLATLTRVLVSFMALFTCLMIIPNPSYPPYIVTLQIYPVLLVFAILILDIWYRGQKKG